MPLATASEALNEYTIIRWMLIHADDMETQIKIVYEYSKALERGLSIREAATMALAELNLL